MQKNPWHEKLKTALLIRMFNRIFESNRTVAVNHVSHMKFLLDIWKIFEENQEFAKKIGISQKEFDQKMKNISDDYNLIHNLYIDYKEIFDQPSQDFDNN